MLPSFLEVKALSFANVLTMFFFFQGLAGNVMRTLVERVALLEASLLRCKLILFEDLVGLGDENLDHYCNVPR